MRFEKWQALGNDYAIVERDVLPFELTPERVRAICAPHTGIGADGMLELSRTDEPGFVASLRIFNPDGSEAELSGNGAREAILYLRRAGWTDQQQFSIRTAAGELRPTILGDTTCRVGQTGSDRLLADRFGPFVQHKDKRRAQAAEKTRQAVLTEPEAIPLRHHLQQHHVIPIGRRGQRPILQSLFEECQRPVTQHAIGWQLQRVGEHRYVRSHTLVIIIDAAQMRARGVGERS